MKKILVIEDNVDVRENLVEILELSGYQIESAENGKLGIKAARDFGPDLILCDVMMPELDGFGVMKILNKDPDLNHIPLIFLTAKAEKSDFRKGMGLGAEDYLTKPFDDTELLETIEVRLKKAERIQKFESTDQGLQRFFSEAKSQKELENLSMDKEVRSYKQKDSIFTEGQNPRWIYFIVEGKVKTFKTNDYGKELTIDILGEGDFFGYNALITDTAYQVSAACIEECTLRLIPKDDFTLLVYNNRDFGAQFIKMLASKNSTKEAKLLELAYSSVRKKVANALLTYAGKANHNENESITLHVSRDDLAALAGTAKETLIRTLSDFKAEGLVVVDGNAIEICDREELADLIG